MGTLIGFIIFLFVCNFLADKLGGLGCLGLLLLLVFATICSKLYEDFGTIALLLPGLVLAPIILFGILVQWLYSPYLKKGMTLEEAIIQFEKEKEARKKNLNLNP
jgi:energy-coupling factor transporter transmembrane protein EcfT